MIYNFDELSFQIVTIANFSHKKGRFCVEKRPFAALSYRVSGTGAFSVGGKRLTVKPGDVLFLPAHTPYEVEYSESRHRIKWSGVAFVRVCSESIVFFPKDCTADLMIVAQIKHKAEIMGFLKDNHIQIKKIGQ